MNSNTPHAVSAVLGRHVFTPEGAYVGDIVELLYDPDNGRIGDAVVIPGGPFGVDNRWMCIPFQTMRYRPDHDCYVLRVAHRTLSSRVADEAICRLVRERTLRRRPIARSSPVFDTSSEPSLRRAAANAE